LRTGTGDEPTHGFRVGKPFAVATIRNHGIVRSLARQPFNLAADEYVTARNLELALASQAKEKQLLVQLKAYFKQEPLKAITAKRVIEYRAWRADQKVGPATLNAELGILRRILKRAKLWARIADDIRPLKEPRSIGRALTEEEKQRLVKTGRYATGMGNGLPGRNHLPEYHCERL
jgi:hypothetical protein